MPNCFLEGKGQVLANITNALQDELLAGSMPYLFKKMQQNYGAFYRIVYEG